ncbi:LysR family transcriptional regulator [Curvibacter sp. CHRR-16]|uniref:LysR family transcriptional regulator n=1 Tax=Curvibacter sp. CHRR-16 TaxID=2835872 RepID=UPI001BDB3169|nr:LysR family transcriptional regulator [Curvibacter sp. CHRR-16]MBT0570492.1 LysR family transcriptional regulator [Curvibacter sp. CHRR-16]
MDTLLSLRVLDTVAELKSFGAAAERHSMSPAMVTKHVKHIEARVGARLLNRTSRNVSLTEAGALYLQRMRPLLGGLDEVEAQLSQSVIRPSGTLRVSLPVWMANQAFAKLTAQYKQRCPDVLLELDFNPRPVGLVEDAFDLAIRVSMSLEPGLIARKLGDIQFRLVAAPAWLQQHGHPAGLADLDGAPFLAYTQVARDGRVRLQTEQGPHEIQFHPVLLSSNEALLMHAAMEGMGYSFMPHWLVDGDIAAGRLVHVLPDLVRPSIPLSAVYPDRSFLPAKVRSFLDYLAHSGFPGAGD